MIALLSRLLPTLRARLIGALLLAVLLAVVAETISHMVEESRRLERELRRAVGAAIERRTPVHQLSHVTRTILDERRDRPDQSLEDKVRSVEARLAAE